MLLCLSSQCDVESALLERQQAEVAGVVAGPLGEQEHAAEGRERTIGQW